MTPYELKKYIVENNYIRDIVEDLGCHDFREYRKEYRMGLPGHSNKTAIAIKKDTLHTKIFLPDQKIIRNDIITLVMHIKNIKFPNAMKYLHDFLGLKFNKIFSKKSKRDNQEDMLNIFKKVKKRRFICNQEDIDFYDESILEEYTPYPHIEWIREGIMPWTCKIFNIGFSNKRKRITIPHRYWAGDDNTIIGIMGRTVIKEHDLLDIPKYFPLKSFPKSMNLYGLYENYKNIQNKGYAVVYEAEKSVLKTHSWGEKTGVGLCCHDISPEQIKILIGLDVDIIFAMDRGVNRNHIRSMCNNFYGIRNVFYIWDKYKILGSDESKNSPVDCGKKKFDYLMKYKVKYDSKERSEYLKWLEKQKKN